MERFKVRWLKIHRSGFWCPWALTFHFAFFMKTHTSHTYSKETRDFPFTWRPRSSCVCHFFHVDFNKPLRVTKYHFANICRFCFEKFKCMKGKCLRWNHVDCITWGMSHEYQRNTFSHFIAYLWQWTVKRFFQFNRFDGYKRQQHIFVMPLDCCHIAYKFATKNINCSQTIDSVYTFYAHFNGIEKMSLSRTDIKNGCEQRKRVPKGQNR